MKLIRYVRLYIVTREVLQKTYVAYILYHQLVLIEHVTW